jgi:sirohydrochlorin ferrochelatase
MIETHNPASAGPDDSSRAVPTAALLVAHGSRRHEANLDLVSLAEAVRAGGNYPIVEIAYLELASPTIPEGAARCVAQGAQRVLLLPYFLSAGAHVCEDLERYRCELSAHFRSVRFELCRPLSLHPGLAAIVLDRLREAEQSGRE